LLLFLMGFLAILPVSLVTICLFGIFVFTGQALFYMVLTVNIANTIEYNQYKTGERNEGIIFSLRPFMAKMASALEQGFITLVLVTSGIYLLSQNVSELEKQKNIYDNLEVAEQLEYKANILLKDNIFVGEEYKKYSPEEIEQFYEMLKDVEFVEEKGKNVMLITDTADANFRDLATTKMRLLLRIAITVVPTLLITTAYIILKKKFIIDEAMYEKMVAEIKAKQAI
ncbi:MAG TPA: MFS transporter, partial [Bacilli bacterium]|nr:MFS transporter [Bacilli bacterium]